jgi:ketosteroid isomerase-like protein
MSRLGRLTLLAFLAVSAPVAGFADDKSKATTAVWNRHVANATAKNIDAVLEDFTDESVIVTSDSVIEGKAAIRAFFEEFLAGITPEAIKSMFVNAETAHGKVMVFNFTIGVAKRTFQDTALIEDGKIKVLATVNYAAE